MVTNRETLLNLNTQTLHLLQQTAEYFTDQHHQAYLVGGSLRNILLGEPCIDWDITASGDIPSMARRLADKLGGHYAYLHDKACRVVVPLTEGQESGQGKQEVIFDIAPLKGGSIENDLRQRDFTINAIAVLLDDVVRYFATRNALHLIDPV